MKKNLVLALAITSLFCLVGSALASGQGVYVYNGGSNYVGVGVTGVPGVTVTNSQISMTFAEQGIVIGGNYFPVASEFNLSGGDVAAKVGNSHSGAYANVSNDWNFSASMSNQGAGASLGSDSSGYTYTQHAAAAEGGGFNQSQVNMPGVEMDSFTGGSVFSVGNANANYNSSSNVNVTLW